MKNKFLYIILVLIFLAGLSLLLYPILSDAYNSWLHSKAIAEYTQQVDELEQETFLKEWEKADIYNKEDDKHSKPILFFLDEPETFLHPKAQEKLIDALEKISGQSQTFIITHSPYLLRKYKKETHSINIFSRTSGVNKIKAGIELGILGSLSPSWGEINYHAFDISSNEFHNELYGYLQELAANNYDSKYYSPAEFDKYLASHNISKDIDYIHITKNGDYKYKTTLPTYIRNQIHHPENQKNTKFSKDQLEESVNLLIRTIEQETKAST